MKELKGDIQRAARALIPAKWPLTRRLSMPKGGSEEVQLRQAGHGWRQEGRGVNHAKGKWIGGAKHAIKNAEKKPRLPRMTERAAAQKELAKAKEGLAAGEQALKERMAALEMAKRAEKEGPRDSGSR